MRESSQIRNQIMEERARRGEEGEDEIGTET